MTTSLKNQKEKIFHNILSFLDKKFESVLDLGCGSGILAMAYAKTYQGGVDAVDIDPESVLVTSNSAKINTRHFSKNCLELSTSQ